MKTKRLWLSWLYLFTLCAALGFIPKPYGLIKALLVLAAVCFFVPGGLLVVRGSRKDLKKIIFLSILSLVLTMALVILNFASVLMPEIFGKLFYILMGIVSAPMLCGQFWVLSLFGWASLLAAGIFRLSEKGK